MIFTERTIKIANDVCKIDNPIVLYRGDYNVEIRFTIIECPYKYSTKNSSNIIETVDASYGQLVIKVPNDGSPIFSDVVETNEGSVVFTLSGEMIDESIEVGDYTFQIRLFDANRESRATIPPVENGISIREPIASEDITSTNEVNIATVGYALTTAATPETAFDNEGNYNKTTWATGDRITEAKLNKIEAAIDGVNKKVASGGTGGTVDSSRYVTKETGNANQITFSDGQTFQAKLDAGMLKGDKGDAGEQGPQGIQGQKGDIGNPTDEQVKNAINEAIANGDIVAGGLTSTAQTLLISILKNAVFTSDQSANISLLQSELAKGNSGGSSGGGSETTKYTITNTLNNATTSNNIALIDANSSYTATITINEGYTLDAITVTMGGTDITNTAVSGTTITINAVTGNVVITVTTTARSEGELLQDSLVGFFDLRSAIVESPYYLTGWGNVAKLTTPSCSDYFMFTNSGTYTVSSDYGVANWNSRGIRQMVNETASISINNNSNSIIGLVYGQCICGLHGMIITTNLSNSIKFTPKYVNSSGETKSLSSIDISARNYKDVPGYSLYALTQSATELKLYINGELKATVNSSECTDFDHWNFSVDSPFGCHYAGVDNYSTAFAIYNKTLSPVEVVEVTEYFKTLEVK